MIKTIRKKRMKQSINKAIFPFISALILAACGGSAPEEPVAPAPEPAAPKVVTPAPKTVQKPKAPVKKTAPAPKTTLNAAELTARLKQWDKKLATLETAFAQNTSYDGVEVSRSMGKLFYDRAQNRLRLDTTSPEGDLEQTAITDKKDIVILDEAGNMVTTLSWTDWQQGQPNQALFDFGNYTALVERHNATVKSQTDKEAVLLLTPKEGEEYQLLLTLTAPDYFPQVLAITSDLMTTKAVLKQIQKNQPLPAAVFGGFKK